MARNVEYIKLTCNYCNKSFEVVPWIFRQRGYVKFCGTKCRYAHNKGMNNPAYKGPYEDRYCKCGCRKKLKNDTSQNRGCNYLKGHFVQSRARLSYIAKKAIMVTQKTLKERYGVTNPSQVPSAMDKRRKTWKKKYGVTNAGLLSQSPTKIEIKVWNYLDEIGVKYIKNHNVDKYFIDASIPSKKLAIEVDGDYWHGRPSQKIRDKTKDKKLISLGWRVLRLPGHLINNNFADCKKEILVALGGDVYDE